MTRPKHYDGVRMEYVPGTPSDQEYQPEDMRLFESYVGSITMPSVLERTLAPDFVQYDGGLLGLPYDVQLAPNLLVAAGRDNFIRIFRDMVAHQTTPDGMIEGAWISRAAYEPFEDRIKAILAEQNSAVAFPAGRLVAAAAVRFPNRLGEQPLDLPPPFAGLLDEGQEPFAPLSRETYPTKGFTIDVVQSLYIDDKTGLFTGRGGLVVNARAVPLAINAQYTDPAFRTLSPGTVAQAVMEYPID